MPNTWDRLPCDVPIRDLLDRIADQMRHRRVFSAYDLGRQQPKGPNGRGRCRWCGDEVPKGRKCWCGEDCITDYLCVFDTKGARDFVWERDRGICQMCGTDLRPLEMATWHALKHKMQAAMELLAIGRVASGRYAPGASVWRHVAMHWLIRRAQAGGEDHLSCEAVTREGWDAMASRRHELTRSLNVAWVPVWQSVKDARRAAGIRDGEAAWECDHIVPVIEGGGTLGRDNLRVLCTACHKGETAALAARRAAVRPKGQAERRRKRHEARLAARMGQLTLFQNRNERAG